jgi:hypothetical protein
MHSPDPIRSDRFAAAGRLVRTAVAAVLLISAVIAAHWVVCAGRRLQSPCALLEAFDLPGVALVPAGRPERLPASVPAAVDLRYDPHLFRPAPDPADLLRKGDGP